MKTLQQLKQEILQDGVIDQNEVQELETVLYADGVIDKEEADFLFDLNDSVSGKANHRSWEQLFVNAITSFLLEDETSPGEIDESEANWLYEKLHGDGVIDNVEMALLKNLKAKAKVMPENLQSLL